MEEERVYEISIKGTAPLLQHRFFGEDKRIEKQTASHDPAHEAENSLYRLLDGTIYEPAEHIEGAMKQAAKDFRIPGKGKRSYSVLIFAETEVQPRCIPIRGLDGDAPSWVTDARPVVIRATRARIFRYRPRFDDWRLDFKLIVKDLQIPEEAVSQILEHAGKHEGLGDFRPKYGKFAVIGFRRKV